MPTSRVAASSGTSRASSSGPLRPSPARGAPAMGQAAALGLALTAHAMRDNTPFIRRATLRGGATALVNARPTAANVRWAVDRLMARFDELGDPPDDGHAVADVLRQEADT